MTRSVLQCTDSLEYQQQGVGKHASDDEREAPRQSLLIRAAKLVVGDREMLCIVHNISASGIMIRTFTPIPDAKAMLLETETGERHDVELI